MMSERPTIADVARVAGVSKGLVSFALNDKPGVSVETRQRILSVASELGWKPSMRARSLSSRRAYAVGLVIARDPGIIAADPFFPALIAGIEIALAPAGQVLVLSMVADEEAEIASYRQLVENDRVDGVILTDLRTNDARIALAVELGLSAVTLGHPDIPSPFPAVTVDDAAGIRAAVAHLVALGHTRIAHVGGPSRMLHGSRRRNSFLAALAEAGLSGELAIETDFSSADGARVTADLLALAEPPTAIVYSNDPMAIAGMSVAQRAGFSIPQDLSVTGFDGSDLGNFTNPSLTSVSTQVQEWGRAATDALLRVIAGEDVVDVELAPAQLVPRESSAGPPRT
ncbi:LacI family DNA-binding transcriptional regulator [Glaciihabitans sp. dw_435]|uniref:LacI family DNA-binding transcriptional regulator n=1 Tax=Glaciihabitans sp. dw_435 TaxID=2720081 RepID=UPI001BD5FB2C|nr:LacI family DNA-binding transcriptional regulator [Glaciihabitans sp. dw_435]